MAKEDQKEKIENEPDYIYCPSADNSISKFIAKHPNGVTDEKAAQVLLMTKEKFQKYYEEAIEMLRKDMGIKEDLDNE